MEKKYLYVLLILSMLTVSCRTYQASSESNKTDIERKDKYERDSIIVHDSVIVFARADTVYKERWRTEYKDRILQQVDTIVRVDERVVETVVEKKIIPKWTWYCVGVCVLLIVVLVIWVIYRAYRAYRHL